ncbi:MAG: cysteine hydrolase family protein [Thermomicrobiales bacterium]
MKPWSPDDTALLVIDVQEAVDDPSRGHRNNAEAEENIARLLAAFREAGIRCIHVRDDSLDPESLFHPSKPGNKIKDLVAPLPGEWLIVKHVHSAFIGTDLEERLRQAGITRLVITGLVTNYCVETTARMAGNLGFDTYMVEDAAAAWDQVGPDGRHFTAEDIHAITMMSLQDFGTITSTEEVIQAIASPIGAAAS